MANSSILLAEGWPEMGSSLCFGQENLRIQRCSKPKGIPSSFSSRLYHLCRRWVLLLFWRVETDDSKVLKLWLRE
ncbi:hypothetical protein YC2023_094139 [Brassica napus]